MSNSCEDTGINGNTAPGYKFIFNQWNDGSKDNPRTITVNEDTTIKAQYIFEGYLLQVYAHIVGGGFLHTQVYIYDELIGTTWGTRVETYPPDGPLNGTGLFGLIVQIMEGGNHKVSLVQGVDANDPNYKYVFQYWEDGSTNNPRNITVNGNMIIRGYFIRTHITDINGDGKVNSDDFMIFAGAYGSKTGQSAYDPYCDFDRDGKIGPIDFAVFAGDYGKSYT